MVINFGNGLTAATSRTAGVHGAIRSTSGVEHPEVEVRGLEGTLRDGGTIFGTRYPMRRMTFAVDFRGVSRRELARAFIPGSQARLESERGFIDATLDTFAFASPNLHDTRVTLSYVCQRPFISAGTVLLSAGADASSGLTYPYTYPYTYQTINAVSSYHFLAETEVAAEPVVTITLAVPSSELTVTLGETMVIDAELGAGDTVRIDSASRTVTINGTLALDALDIDSRWPVVVAGNNTLTISELGIVTVEYEPPLLGLL